MELAKIKVDPVEGDDEDVGGFGVTTGDLGIGGEQRIVREVGEEMYVYATGITHGV